MKTEDNFRTKYWL